eukprot:maker-scaffold25_size650667-snap-gene-5.28 protein:Tk06712 transcript:maker-scaffold25_size650667-snap-gene-5.28-mRNA-1 annotation:"hypothetical protein L798_06649"
MWLETVALFSVFTLYWVTASQPRARNGIYSRPGPFYFIKYCFFYLLISLRKMSASKSGDAGRGKKSHANPQMMEKPQPFSDHPRAFDAVFFSGSDSRGNFLVTAMERKKDNNANGIFYVKLDGLGLFRGIWLPDTSMQSEDDSNWNAQGLQFGPIESFRQWSLNYAGPVEKMGNKSSVLKLALEGKWSSDHGIFDYDTDMSPSAAARAFAKEPWNDQYFKDLQKAHQTHYEQLGHLKVTIELEGTSDPITLDMQSFRDHSYGTKRDWKLMHRYVFHHVFLPNRWKAVIGVVCQPHTCTSLECGFVCLPNGTIAPVDQCSLELANHGEGGDPPTQYGFTFHAGSEEYQVQVNVEDRIPHYYGEEHECRILECLASYEVNGIPGSGICEWQNRNVEPMK